MSVDDIMKLSAVLLICIAAACDQVQAQLEWCSGSYLRGAVQRCAKAYGASQGDIHDYVYLNNAASEKATCFRGCIFNECQTFNPDGTFRSALPKLSAFLVSRIDSWKYDITEPIATNCIKTIPHGYNRCELTEAYLRCLTENSPVKLTVVGGV